MNDRRQFLKATGLIGAASLIPFDKKSFAKSNTSSNSCVLIPTETAGPFPLDLSDNSFYFRQDVRESKTGVQLNLRMKIIGVDNCEPMQNLRVNIWHCDKDGLYSGYQTETGLTYLRGYQITDANGEVEFITIFPGWYNGRVCHIHFQVYVNSSYAAVSQLTFDHATKNTLYTANSSTYIKGVDPLTPLADGIFADGYDYQLATLTPNSSTGGYDSYLEVTIQGSGTMPTGYAEMQAAKQFMLGQNFPNPYKDETTIPFELKQDADVKLELWDLMGRRVASTPIQSLLAGDRQIKLNMQSLGLKTGNYIYQLEVANNKGVFRSGKMMTATR